MIEERRVYIESLFDSLSTGNQNKLMKIARKLVEGYDGEIMLQVKKGGIAWVRWTQTDAGD